ncbi:MAG: peptide deformylase [Clostridia bacterium]|nr:peptide deformylase [Clostridia bacterium]
MITAGDELLRKKSRPVDTINDRILTLLDDMVDTMRAANGVGLAAPQIGVLRRIVVVECEPGEVLELINPEIVATEGEQQALEGCLSVPGKNGITTRPAKVTLEALNRHGEKCTYNAEGLLAYCFCHEVDHLDGIHYIDHARMLTDEELEELYE